MTMAHRIAVMDRGQIMQVATPSELYEEPNSRWVAKFIGDVNLIEGGVAAAGPDGIVIETVAGRRFHASAGAGEDGAKVGAKVWLALRPEKVRMTPEPLPGDGRNGVGGRVWDIGYLGGISVYKVKLDDGSFMLASLANVKRVTEREIGWDQQVWLSWPPDAAIVLTR